MHLDPSRERRRKAVRGSCAALWIVLFCGCVTQRVLPEEELLCAIENDDAPTVEKFLDTGASPNSLADVPLRWTLLHMAAIHGSVNVARLLVEEGADVRRMDIGGVLPIELAHKHGYVQVCEILAQPTVPPVSPDDMRRRALHELLDRFVWPEIDGGVVFLRLDGRDPDASELADLSDGGHSVQSASSLKGSPDGVLIDISFAEWDVGPTCSVTFGVYRGALSGYRFAGRLLWKYGQLLVLRGASCES